MSTPLSLREIEAFLVLADELHFGRAGDRLGLTPSRVSQILRSVERQIGAPLVYRTSHHVELTALGERLRREAGPTYTAFLRMLEGVQTAARGGAQVLKLGLYSDTAIAQLTAVVRAFQNAVPDCSVEASDVPVKDPYGPLLRGDSDLMVSWLPHGQRDLVTGPVLSREPVVLAIARDHPLAGRSVVEIADLAGFEVSGSVSVPHISPGGRRIPEVSVADLTGRRLSTARIRGDGYRLTSELVFRIATGRVVHPTVRSLADKLAHPDVVSVPFAAVPPVRSALVWRSGLRNPAVSQFIRIAEQMSEPSQL